MKTSCFLAPSTGRKVAPFSRSRRVIGSKSSTPDRWSCSISAFVHGVPGEEIDPRQIVADLSIAQRGIEEPLEGVQLQDASILLNGFKRYRCARKLQLRSVAYASLGDDEVAGIMNLLRISNNRALSILEQAAFIDELYATGCLSVAEMAKELSRDRKSVV